MVSYCLKCKNILTESMNPKVIETKSGRTMLFSNVLYVVLKNQNLLKNKKQKNY